ncbi:MAG: glycoside hydrolase family 3 protein, partial [Sphingobacteriaceae bacterium]
MRHPFLFIIFLTVLSFSLLSWGRFTTPQQLFTKPISYPYLNAKLPVNQRVQDLLSRMTLREKVAQMCQYVGLEHMAATEKRMNKQQLVNNDAYAFYPGYTTDNIKSMVKNGLIGSFLHVVTVKEANELQVLAQKSRLKIPLLIGIDAIHGNGMVAGSTIFPSPIGLAATWDTALVRLTARYTAEEMRATGSQWAFSPNLDIARDARWGRIGETYGEDPYLVTQMGLAVISGLQGKLTNNTNVLACAKHLIAGSQPINGLNVAPSDISERTLKEIFLPPYEAAVHAGVYSVMPAHNEINGKPCHADKELMTDLLRDQWGFKGFYVSDFMDIERLALVHKTAEIYFEYITTYKNRRPEYNFTNIYEDAQLKNQYTNFENPT